MFWNGRNVLFCSIFFGVMNGSCKAVFTASSCKAVFIAILFGLLQLQLFGSCQSVLQKTRCQACHSGTLFCFLRGHLQLFVTDIVFNIYSLGRGHRKWNEKIFLTFCSAAVGYWKMTTCCGSANMWMAQYVSGLDWNWIVFIIECHI